MTDSLPPLSLDRWLKTLEDEYLSDYIPSGGSAVKFVTGTDAVLSRVLSSLSEVAASTGCRYAPLDPGKPDAAGKRPDLHKIDKLFFKLTENVDWEECASRQARQYLEKQGIHLIEGRALGDLEQIALDNDRDPQDLLSQYQRELATPLIKDPRLSIEFRTAITSLGRSLLTPDAVTPTTKEVLLGWFAGRSQPGASTALKKVQIYERINLANARNMLASFCRWLPQTGSSGLVATFDFRPYEFKKIAKSIRQQEQIEKVREAVARNADNFELSALTQDVNASDPEVFYSDAAYMQMLTMLRRFIDEIDRFDNLLLVVLTSPNFYKDKALDPAIKRCYFDYDALQTRIGQEVHDARFANPAASLVHLEEAK